MSKFISINELRERLNLEEKDSVDLIFDIDKFDFTRCFQIGIDQHLANEEFNVSLVINQKFDQVKNIKDVMDTNTVSAIVKVKNDNEYLNYELVAMPSGNYNLEIIGFKY